MKSPQVNQAKFGAYLTPPQGGARLAVYKAQVESLVQDIGITELFALPPTARQFYINTMIEVRSESKGFVLQATGSPVVCRTKSNGAQVEIGTEPTKVSLSEGLIVFGKFGMYTENEMEAGWRAGSVEEVGATSEMKEADAKEVVEQAKAMMEQAQEMLKAAQAQLKETKNESRSAKQLTKEQEKDFDEFLETAIESGVITKSGNWYSFGEQSLGNGKENTMEFLQENNDVLRAIYAAIETAKEPETQA